MRVQRERKRRERTVENKREEKREEIKTAGVKTQTDIRLCVRRMSEVLLMVPHANACSGKTPSKRRVNSKEKPLFLSKFEIVAGVFEYAD